MATSSNDMTTRAASYRRTVLVVRFSSLGDVAMAIPVVYAACAANPDTRFVFLTKAPVAQLFVNSPQNLVICGADMKVEYAGATGLIRLFRKLNKQYRFDAFIDLHDVLRTRIIGMICRLRGISTSRIDKGRMEKKRLTREKNKKRIQLKTSIERYADAFAHAGISVDGNFTGIFGAGKAPQSTFADITAPKAAGETWIAIAPFAAHANKIYPLHLMERVVAELSNRHGVKIFLFGGGAKERETLGAWSQRHPNVTSMAEKRHGFPKELALLSHVDVMVSMDSSNMHLASLVGVPVVSIWGATHPFCGFAGWNNRSDLRVQRDDMPCRPCSAFGNKPCRLGDTPCLNGIAPETIIEKIDKALSNG